MQHGADRDVFNTLRCINPDCGYWMPCSIKGEVPRGPKKNRTRSKIMSSKYRVKVLVNLYDGEKEKHTFSLDLELPFIPTVGIAVQRKGSVVPIGPFEQVVYNLDEDVFFCWKEAWVTRRLEGSLLDSTEATKRVMENLKLDGWKEV